MNYGELKIKLNNIVESIKGITNVSGFNLNIILNNIIEYFENKSIDLNKNINNQGLGQYTYFANNNDSDTVGDVRYYATHVHPTSYFMIEKCIVGNPVKGSGTWSNIFSTAG